MIEQKVENVTQQDFTLAGCLKQVEKAGRICYGSEDKITNDSYKAFTNMLIRNKHFSPFGHGTLIIDISMLADYASYSDFTHLMEFIKHYESRYRQQDNGFCIISARVLAEASDHYNTHFLDVVSPCIMDFEEIRNKIDKNNERLTVKCTTSIAMTRELNRHAWSLDIAEKSTRYVETHIWIKPYNWNQMTEEQKALYRDSSHISMYDYGQLLKTFPKQIARDILPLNTATEVYYTAFRYQWKDVIAKRTAKGVHPQMIDLMNKIKNVL